MVCNKRLAFLRCGRIPLKITPCKVPALLSQLTKVEEESEKLKSEQASLENKNQSNQAQVCSNAYVLL